MGQKEEILRMLRKVAMARDEEKFQDSVKSLRESAVWKENVKFQHYFNKIWFPHHKVLTINVSNLLTVFERKVTKLHIFCQ